MNKSTCYVKVKWGVANQLFQLAAAFAYAKRYNKNLIVDPTDWEQTQGNHPITYADTIYSNFQFGVAPSSATVIQEIDDFCYRPIPYHAGDVVLKGLYQSLQYFREYSEEFVSLLKLPEVDYKRTDYSNTEVFFHIRRGDYTTNNWLYVCKTEYFKYFFEKYKYMNIKVCTDSPDVVRNEFSDYNFEIIKHDLDLKDIVRMSHSDIFVGSNSTFSWWASFLRKQECYFPKPWFANDSPHLYTDFYRDDMNIHDASLDSSSVLHVHDSVWFGHGIFSCFSVGLEKLCLFYVDKNRLPKLIDRFNQFTAYKDDLNTDISKILFSEKVSPSINGISNVFSVWDQFKPYHSINIENYKSLVDCYFTPSIVVNNKIEDICNSIEYDLDSVLAVCYRGNDKIKETRIGSYEEYIQKVKEVLNNNPQYKVIYLQTDEIEFADKFRAVYKNTYVNDSIPLISKTPDKAIQHILPPDKRIEFACNFFASVAFMSKCGGVITHSGNIGIWIALYRGNTNNVYQYLNGEWY
jgi:hypothetical protein